MLLWPPTLPSATLGHFRLLPALLVRREPAEVPALQLARYSKKGLPKLRPASKLGPSQPAREKELKT
jgi:hypothetical protein